MKRNWFRRGAALLLALAMLASLAGCGAPKAPVTPEVERLLTAQLGLLDDLISESEREEAAELLAGVMLLREKREAEGTYEKSKREQKLLEELNGCYDQWTVEYITDEFLKWRSYSSMVAKTTMEYKVDHADNSLIPDWRMRPSDSVVAAHQAVWDSTRALLPEGAFDHFDRVVIETDGEFGSLAGVDRLDDEGEKWIIYIDPADTENLDLFTETVIHEYMHYLSLCKGQVTYTDQQTMDTYNEWGMVAQEDSYLNQFYQRFWSDYLDDRLVDRDSYAFYFRHMDDFVGDYAALDPSEDIADSFAYFVKYSAPVGDEVYKQKINFFYEFDELVELREEIRAIMEPLGVLRQVPEGYAASMEDGEIGYAA